MKVYISYKREDSHAADHVAAIMGAGGHEVLSERNLIPGADWDSSIARMIRDSDVVVVLWSARSRESEFVMREASLAIELNKYLGFVLGEIELPFQFRMIQHLFLAPDGSERRSGMIQEALAGFEGRLSEPRSINRSVRQAAKKRERRSPQAQEQYVDLDVPPSLRRTPEAPSPAYQQASPPMFEAGASQAPIAPPAPVAAPTPPAVTPAEAETRGYDVFISYSRKDTNACELVFKMLVERDLVPWYDKDMGSGAFKTKIDERISKAAVFVLLLSKNSVASANVSKELSMAVGSDRLIIPISIDGIVAKDLKGTFRYELIELNIFNAEPAAPESWAEVVKTIADGVKDVRAEAGVVAPPALPLPVAVPAIAPKAKRPVLFAVASFLSALLQQGAVGYAAWAFFGADIPLAAAIALASGIVIYPLAYLTALLARLAFRPSVG